MDNEFEKWLASEDGKKCADYPITGGSEYLRNRLWWAFQAGRDVERNAGRDEGEHG